MAVLFIWVFITDKTKINKLEEENNEMLKLLINNQKNIAESNKNIAEGNNNIARSLEIISNNLITIDKKIDRNYEVELKNN